MVALVLLCSGVSCTNSDELFGNDLIPPDQNMGSAIDSSILVRTYIDSVGSIDTHIWGYYTPFIGSYVDPLVGRTDAQVFVNFSPIGFDHSHYFGENPVIDSIRYTINFSDVIGDTTTSMSVWIDVYEVKGYVFKQDSSYFNTFDMSPYIGDEPLFSFEQKGVGYTYGKIDNEEFQKRLLDNSQDKDNIYYDDTVFHESFPGLYFKCRTKNTVDEGHMLKLDLSNSAMYIFYRNTGPNKPDTVAYNSLDQKMFFYGDDTYDYISFMTIQHDYSLANELEGGVMEAEIGSRDKPSEYMYVQGLAGLMGKLELDSLSLDSLKREVQLKGYSHIALNRAELQVKMADAGIEQYNKSFPELGLYHNMLEYDFLSEYNSVMDGGATGYVSTMGGKLNRSLGVYKFDVTSYVQQLLRGKETRYETELQTAWNASRDDRNNFSRSWVYGTDSSYPPKLILTYTMIK